MFSTYFEHLFNFFSTSFRTRFSNGSLKTTCQQVVFRKPLVNRWFSLKTTCQPVVFLANHLSAGGFLENHLSTSGFQDLGLGVESWWFDDQNDTLEVKVYSQWLLLCFQPIFSLFSTSFQHFFGLDSQAVLWKPLVSRWFSGNHLSTGGFPWKPLVNRWFSLKTTCQPVSYTHLTLPTIYSV